VPFEIRSSSAIRRCDVPLFDEPAETGAGLGVERLGAANADAAAASRLTEPSAGRTTDSHSPSNAWRVI